MAQFVRDATAELKDLVDESCRNDRRIGGNNIHNGLLGVLTT